MAIFHWIRKLADSCCQIRPLNASLSTGVLLFLIVCIASPSAASEQQLIDLQKQLNQQQQQLQSRQQQVKQAQQSLRQAELALAKSAQSRRKLKAQQNDLTQQQQDLIKQQKTLEKSITQQQQALAAQLNANYRIDKQQGLKLLLEPDSALSQTRNLRYFDYLAKAQSDAIKSLQQAQHDLDVNRQALEKNQLAIQTALTKQQKLESQAKQQQQQRQQQLNKLAKLYQSDKDKAEQLKQQTAELELQISREIEKQQLAQEQKRLQQEALEQEKQQQQQTLSKLAGLESQQGKLPWPLKGRVLHEYNSRNQGQHRWQGIVIDSHPGSKVRAIADGNVVYADWLRGFGLVLVLDHGKDYLSLYGYNQDLARELGERVKAGDTVSYAGQTGGQETNALFFQIRHRGAAIDPKPWLKP